MSDRAGLCGISRPRRTKSPSHLYLWPEARRLRCHRARATPALATSPIIGHLKAKRSPRAPLPQRPRRRRRQRRSLSLFTVLRFVVGVGLAGCTTPITALIVELTPTRLRTLITGFLVVFASVGALIAALVAATLLGLLGWRGVAAAGVPPAVMGLLLMLLLPESARWLVAKGRFAEAQATVARTLGLPLDQVPLPSTLPASEPGHSLLELLARPRFFWLTVITWMGVATAIYGVYLWRPTIIALLLKIPAAQAAHAFVYVTLGGIFGKVLLSLLAQKIGGKRVGEIQGYVAALGLVVAALCFPLTIGGFPVFILALITTVFFLDGGLSNLAPYIVEVYGVRLGARSAGSRRRRTASVRSWILFALR
ncbi:MAG: MFS transporter [Xanthobacteraceae bacterium]|nr:MFS transporter [Xanthobacteraceae bacterium]